MRKYLNNFTRKRGATPGQATVELALTLMIFLLLVFGILEAGRLIFINSSVENGAREGAHYLSTNPHASPEDLRAVVLSKLVMVDGNDVDIVVPEMPVCDFCPITVTVTYPWTTVVPILNFGSLTLQASSTRLIENAQP